MSTTTWIILVVAGFFLLGLLSRLWPRIRARWAKWKAKSAGSEETWTKYMSVQWVILFAAFLLGIGLSAGFIYLGPIRSEKPQTGGVILEPRRITLDEQHPVYTKQLGSLDQYERVTVLTRTFAPTPTPTPTPPSESAPAEPQRTPARQATPPEPASGTATVTVHRSLDDEGRGDEIRRLQSTSETWTRWEESDPKGQMSLIVEGGPMPVGVELIVYLTPRRR